MLKTELLEIIRNGENSGVELKRDTIDHRALAKELVAFANLQGGRVLLGVEKDGSISGLTRSDPADSEDPDKPGQYTRFEEWVMQACRDKIRPELIPYFEVLREVGPGKKDVAIVQVDRGWDVHHVWHDQHRTYYIRVGSLSREASPEELERLFQQRGTFRAELRPVSGSSIADLDRRRLRDYFERIRGQEIPPDQPSREWREATERKAREEEADHWRELLDLRKKEWQETVEEAWISLLVNTEILSREPETIPVTVAGLLLFGNNPNRFLPQAGIDAVAYLSKEKEYNARGRKTLRGPMVPLMSSNGLVENGLVEQALQFCRDNTEVTTHLADGARRVERRSYPEEALREALVNALVHRDYLLSGTDIELSIYEDRLEVISPGRLPNGITPERMRIGCRSARNQLLKDVMRDYDYLEHMGMGIPRKIIRGMREHNGTEPDLIVDDERFTLRLWKEPQNGTWRRDSP